MRDKIRSFSLLLLIAPTACGGPVAPEAPRGPIPAVTAQAPPGPVVIAEAPPTPGTPCAALYGAYATWAKGCSGTELLAGQLAELIAHCEVRAALPGTGASPATIRDCAAQVVGSSCAALPLSCLSPFDLGARGTPTDVWLGNGAWGRYELFPRAAGTLGAGVSCDLGAQCQSGVCTSHGSCGVCVEMKKVGEACGPLALCNGAAQCTRGVCVEHWLPRGSSCTVPAKGDSKCDRDLYCPKGTCVPLPKVGEACAELSARSRCVHGLVCKDSLCHPVTEEHEGDACDGLTRVCSDEGLTCGEGHCRRPVASVPEGGSCGPDVCALGLTCNYGKCVKAVPAGAHCLASSECAANLRCGPEHRCGAPVADGAYCSAIHDCGDDLWCNIGMHRCQPEAGAGEACDGIPCRVPLKCRAGKCGALNACSVH